jgi:hypothetical protein
VNEWISLLRALTAAGVRFLVVGGIATIAHGFIRATQDLDIWIEPTRENIKVLEGVLVDLGVEMTEELGGLLDPYAFLQIGAPQGRRLDLMSHAAALEFPRAWRDRLEVDLEDFVVPVLGLADLLATKEAVGRHKDLADVESLRALHGLRWEDDDQS